MNKKKTTEAKNLKETMIQETAGRIQIEDLVQEVDCGDVTGRDSNFLGKTELRDLERSTWWNSNGSQMGKWLSKREKKEKKKKRKKEKGSKSKHAYNLVEEKV
jgi:hypothetical protein